MAQHFRKFLLSVTLILALAPSSTRTESASSPPTELPGLDAEHIRDPIFGGKLRTYRGGPAEAPTVVLVHGIDERGAAAWRDITEELSEDYRVIALDLPGFGASTKGNHLYSPERYTRVLDHLIQELAEGPVRLVGHSLGGAIALHYAAEHPETVDHLTVSNVAGILHKGAYAGSLSRPPASSHDTGLDAEGWLVRTAGQTARRLMERLPDIGDLLLSAPGRNMALRGNPTIIAAVALMETDFSTTLFTLSVPTTILWGDEDPITPLRTAHLLAGILPDRDLHIFPGSGHAPMIETPEPFIKVLRQRLDGGSHQGSWSPPVERPGHETLKCNGERGERFTGAYDTVVIRDCQDITLDRVTARRMDIRESRATLIEPRIVGEDVGLTAHGSDLNLTAGTINADTAIETTESDLDIAGTRLRGSSEILRHGQGEESEVIFSVTPVQDGDDWRYLHGIQTFSLGERL